MIHKATEYICAHGHNLITGNHETTFEFTKDDSLTTRGDCIIAVGAKGTKELSEDFKRLASINVKTTSLFFVVLRCVVLCYRSP